MFEILGYIWQSFKTCATLLLALVRSESFSRLVLKDGLTELAAQVPCQLYKAWH